MSVHTRSQQLAQAAFPRIQDRKQRLSKPEFGDYQSFAKKFPALIHTCGLAQAVSFALAKNQTNYINDLSEVLKAANHPEITAARPLETHTREEELGGYLRLSRDAINAASWLKRYVEAAVEDT
jgi:CRISPR-associated protein Cmr5